MILLLGYEISELFSRWQSTMRQAGRTVPIGPDEVEIDFIKNQIETLCEKHQSLEAPKSDINRIDAYL